MKKLIVIIVFVVKWHILFSQENNLVVFFVDAITNGVPVYSNDTCTNSIGIVKEYPEKENWHDVELLGQSKNRYKVRIIAINETNVAPIVGWVEKDQCGVWLHSRYIKPQIFIVELYTKLGQIKPFITLKSKNCYNIDDVDAYSKAVPVFDYKFYNGKYWIKTAIHKNKKRIVVWTTDYCPIIYDSCN